MLQHPIGASFPYLKRRSSYISTAERRLRSVKKGHGNLYIRQSRSGNLLTDRKMNIRAELVQSNWARKSPQQLTALLSVCGTEREKGANFSFAFLHSDSDRARNIWSGTTPIMPPSLSPRVYSCSCPALKYYVTQFKSSGQNNIYHTESHLKHNKCQTIRLHPAIA